MTYYRQVCIQPWQSMVGLAQDFALSILESMPVVLMVQNWYFRRRQMSPHEQSWTDARKQADSMTMG